MRKRWRLAKRAVVAAEGSHAGEPPEALALSAPEIVEPLLVEGLIEDKLEDQARARSILELAIAIARARAPEGGDQATAQDVPAEPAEEPAPESGGDDQATDSSPPDQDSAEPQDAEPAPAAARRQRSTEAGDEPAAETPADQSPEAQAAAARRDRELLLAKGMTVLANLYLSGEQLDKAEALLHEAIGHQEHALWVGYKFSPEAAETLNALASLYSQQGREDDANVLRQRASSMDLRNSFLLKFDDQTRDFLSTYSLPPDQLAAHIEEKLAEAEGKLGTSHPDLLPWLKRLGDAQVQLKQFAEAEAVEGRALAIAEKSFGPEHAKLVGILQDLAHVYEKEDRFAEAEPLYTRAVEISETAYGPEHPKVAEALAESGEAYRRQGRFMDALAQFRRAVALVGPRVAESAGSASHAVGDAAQPQGYAGRVSYMGLIGADLAMAEQDPAKRAPFDEEAFAAVQDMSQTSAGAALAQMSARFESGNSALAAALQQQDGLLADRRELERQLVAALGNDNFALGFEEDEKKAAEESEVRQRLEANKAKLAEVKQALSQDFPDYVELASPRPVTIEETQKLLQPDEALLVYLITGQGNFVFALTKEQMVWKPLDVDALRLEQYVWRRCATPLT